jgi:hypothetical protein
MNILVYNGKYSICSDGYIISNVGTPKRMIGKITKHGYRMVVLTVDGKKIYPLAHRLIAQAFLPNPNNYPQVNHKNGNKTDNRLENLEWCNASYNQQHYVNNNQHKFKINSIIKENIKLDYKTGDFSYRSLAKKYNISKTFVENILKKQ